MLNITIDASMRRIWPPAARSPLRLEAAPKAAYGYVFVCECEGVDVWWDWARMCVGVCAWICVVLFWAWTCVGGWEWTCGGGWAGERARALICGCARVRVCACVYVGVCVCVSVCVSLCDQVCMGDLCVYVGVRLPSFYDIGYLPLLEIR